MKLIPTAKKSIDDEKSIDDVGASTSAASEKSVIPFTNIDVCSVCVDDTIPVGGMHICSLCRGKVHAWCSNHEDITNSANLVCNNCL